MRKIIVGLGLALSITNTSYSQSDFDISQMTFVGDVPTYEKVIELGDDYTKDVLYNNAKTYFANAFRDSKEVIRLDNKEDGIIMGKGNFPFVWHYMTPHDSRENFSLELSVKNGKYRIRIYDVTLDQGFLKSYHNQALKGKKQGSNFYEAVHKGNLALISSIETAMAKKEANNSNW